MSRNLGFLGTIGQKVQTAVTTIVTRSSIPSMVEPEPVVEVVVPVVEPEPVVEVDVPVVEPEPVVEVDVEPEPVGQEPVETNEIEVVEEPSSE